MCAGLTEPTGQCDAGYVCVTRANTSTPVDGLSGYECLPGYFCPKGSAQGVKCPQGTFSSRLGLQNMTECRDCTPGKFCQTDGTYGYELVRRSFICPGDIIIVQALCLLLSMLYLFYIISVCASIFSLLRRLQESENKVFVNYFYIEIYFRSSIFKYITTQLYA